MFEPENELGVIFLFGKYVAENDHTELISISAEFPDATIKTTDGNSDMTWRVEFEYLASNFLRHGHDVRKCDAIICWIDDLRGTQVGMPIPIMELASMDSELCYAQKANRQDKELFYWRNAAETLERQNKSLKMSLDEFDKRSSENIPPRKPKVSDWRDIIANLGGRTKILSASDVQELLVDNGYMRVPESTARRWAKENV